MTLEWAETDARCDRVDEELGRRADLTNPEYAAMARQRIEADAPMFSEVS